MLIIHIISGRIAPSYIILGCPGKIKAGKKVSDYVTLGHLAPTFLEIAGVEPPEDMRFPSILDVILTKKSGSMK